MWQPWPWPWPALHVQEPLPALVACVQRLVVLAREVSAAEGEEEAEGAGPTRRGPGWDDDDDDDIIMDEDGAEETPAQARMPARVCVLGRVLVRVSAPDDDGHGVPTCLAGLHMHATLWRRHTMCVPLPMGDVLPNSLWSPLVCRLHVACTLTTSIHSSLPSTPLARRSHHPHPCPRLRPARTTARTRLWCRGGTAWSPGCCPATPSTSAWSARPT